LVSEEIVPQIVSVPFAAILGQSPTDSS